MILAIVLADWASLEKNNALDARLNELISVACSALALLASTASKCLIKVMQSHQDRDGHADKIFHKSRKSKAGTERCVT